MAQATRYPAPPPPPKAPPIKRVTLDLSAEEAEALYIITRHIGGDPVKSRRGLIDNIREALKAVGVKPESQGRHPFEKDGTSGYITSRSNITFLDDDQVGKDDNRYDNP
jgi:hypothetical protein